MNYKSVLEGRFRRNSLVRLCLETHANRGGERYRRVGLSGSAALVSQALFILTGLISIPLTASYLGAERYGVWLTISSLIAWLTMVDFGLGGNALVNALAEADGNGDRQWAQSLVSTAFWTLSGLAAVIGAAVFALGYLIPVEKIFRLSDPALSGEVRLACIAALVSFLLTFPTGTVFAVYRGYQRGYTGHVWNIAGNLVSLFALIVVTRFRGGLPQLVGAICLARTLASAMNAVYLFRYEAPWLRPVPSAFSRVALRRLMNLGGSYAVIQLASIGIYQSQPFMITQAFGPSSVFVFAVAQRLMTLPINLTYLLTAPLIPAYGEAKARNDWPWIWQTLRGSIVFCTLASSVLVLILGLIARPLMKMLVGPEAVPSTTLLL
ncbi:MAG: hypothetical protein ABL967_20970, partial [Bryobacteraceae bacterium]